MGGFLSQDDFSKLVELAPIVTIDLIVRDADGRVLLGLRTNRPAQSYWFTPGGRIRKSETLDVAFRRIAMKEIGRDLDRKGARLRDVYDHFYDDSAIDGSDFGSRYVVLGYELTIPALSLDDLPPDEHASWRWFALDELLRADDVHDNVKGYFR
ncbi:MAG: GDP-mannose mannosyl hydrolase [Hyphomicrobium sp.]|nr:GDP-mannose mannosyl hydrolase [Hyphomicrobium sp.]